MGIYVLNYNMQTSFNLTSVECVKNLEQIFRSHSRVSFKLYIDNIINKSRSYFNIKNEHAFVVLYYAYIFSLIMKMWLVVFSIM